MFHLIEFNGSFTMELEGEHKQLRGRMRIRNGTRLQAHLKPRVVESPDGPVEVADLYFGDGTSTRSIPFELFSFVSEG